MIRYQAANVPLICAVPPLARGRKFLWVVAGCAALMVRGILVRKGHRPFLSVSRETRSPADRGLPASPRAACRDCVDLRLRSVRPGFVLTMGLVILSGHRGQRLCPDAPLSAGESLPRDGMVR